MKPSARNSALLVAGTYAAVSVAWITFSDRIASMLAVDYARLAWFQTIKGLFFVVATASLLFFFSKRQIGSLIASQARREKEIVDSLREKEALLREIHHRVKNNLQVIISLLNLHDENRERLVDLQGKVRSIAIAHDLLCTSADFSSIDADDFAKRLAETFAGTITIPGTKIEGEGEHIALTADMAVSLGIFIAESCSNAVKHAGRPHRSTTILVSIRGVPDGIVVTIRDDGPGFAEQEAGKASVGLGTTLMDALAAQVKGTVTRRNDKGAVVELAIPSIVCPEPHS